MSKEKLTVEQLNKKIFHLFKLNNDVYSVDLTEEEALKLGLSNTDFQFVLNELKTTNAFIQEAKKDPNHEINLIDPQTIDPQTISDAARAYPSGNLTTSDQSEATDSVFAPSGMGSVLFNCRTNAALFPVYTCRTRSSGIWKAVSDSGTLATTTPISVSLYVSNATISVGFRTSDSNGGYANWQGQ